MIKPSWYDPRFQAASEAPKPKPAAMSGLTVVYVTSRPEPEINWFLDSLAPQINSWEHVEVIIVNSLSLGHESLDTVGSIKNILVVNPKPSIWQGPSRLTKEDWWDVSNARNTGIALCRTEWIAFCDDRCVLIPTWLEAVRAAMAGNYAVCGTYQKRHNMTVENGVIKNAGIITGTDSRFNGREPYPRLVDGGSWYGCTNALPLEWALNVNGWSEDLCGGLSFEDIPFGMTLANNGYPIRFDQRMMMIEDRTPEHLGPVMKRSDYGQSPMDKSHRVQEIFRGSMTSQNSYSLREVREKVLAGEPFPLPSASHNEWFTGKPISEL